MRSETFIVSDGTRLWTEAGGRGCRVLLCNGGPGCCDYLAPVADMLEDIAFVIRWEQRGCGRSDAVRPYDVETCLRDMEAIREHYGLARWIVAGHSWGADLAVAYAEAHSDRVMGVIGLSGGVILKDRDWSEQYHRRKDAVEEAEPDYAYPPNLDVNHGVTLLEGLRAATRAAAAPGGATGAGAVRVWRRGYPPVVAGRAACGAPAVAASLSSCPARRMCCGSRTRTSCGTAAGSSAG